MLSHLQAATGFAAATKMFEDEEVGETGEGQVSWGGGEMCGVT